MVIIFVGSLLGFQLSLVARNLTTIEVRLLRTGMQSALACGIGRRPQRSPPASVEGGGS